MPIPRQTVPALQVPTLDHGRYTLGEVAPRHFTLVVFYRGLHCPICLRYLTAFQQALPEFDRRGVAVIAISTDDDARACGMADKLGSGALRIGYALSLETARQWGLYVSTSRGRTSNGLEEPARFIEPGLFLVRADGTLYYSVVQTMPFARPRVEDLLQAIDVVLEKNYPARGEFVGPD